MLSIEVVQWRGNKDVPLAQASLPAVPRIEEYLELELGDRSIRGKVTRVTYRVQPDNNPITGQKASIQVRINTK